MNSESLQELDLQIKRGDIKRQVQQNVTIQKGNLAENLVESEGWKQLETDLKGDLAGLHLQMETCITLKELSKLQAESKLIRRILNNPVGYIRNRDELLRRNKCQK